MTDIWTCFDHGSFQSGACPKCHREAKQRIAELEADREQLIKDSAKVSFDLREENKRLEAALNYIGDPQNGMVDLAAYARKVRAGDA
jgi:hypothetical protein